MKIGVIADIHGNAVPLDAVLTDLAGEKPDRILCLGDVAAPGPQPRECVERLRGLQCSGVTGNGDDRTLHILEPGGEAHILASLQERGIPEHVAREYLVNDRWCAEKLSLTDLDYLRTYRQTLEIELNQATRLFCFHGTPQSFNEGIPSSASTEELGRYLAGYDATLMACAHIHVQMIRRYRNTLLFNPGSAGGATREYLPGSDGWRYAGWAEYALIYFNVEQGTTGIELRRVPFDRSAVVRAIRASGAPHEEWLLKDWR